jgi:acyl dehydratase
MRGVCFASPVLNGSTLQVQAWKGASTDGKATWSLETRNASGALVISNGVAEIRE